MQQLLTDWPTVNLQKPTHKANVTPSSLRMKKRLGCKFMCSINSWKTSLKSHCDINYNRRSSTNNKVICVTECLTSYAVNKLSHFFCTRRKEASETELLIKSRLTEAWIPPPWSGRLYVDDPGVLLKGDSIWWYPLLNGDPGDESGPLEAKKGEQFLFPIVLSPSPHIFEWQLSLIGIFAW